MIKQVTNNQHRMHGLQSGPPYFHFLLILLLLLQYTGPTRIRRTHGSGIIRQYLAIIKMMGISPGVFVIAIIIIVVPIDGVRVVKVAIVVDVRVDSVKIVAEFAQVRIALFDIVETFFFDFVIVVANYEKRDKRY